MKSKGCLILGYAASVAGYILGVATAVKRMLSGISPWELLSQTEIFFPSFSPIGILSLTGLTAVALCTGLSATGIAWALPCAAAGTYNYGMLSAATFAALGRGGAVRLLWASPIIAVSVLLFSHVSAQALRYSFFTLRTLGLIPRTRGQYTDPDEVMDIPRYLLTSAIAIGVSAVATLYGHLALERIFSP